MRNAAGSGAILRFEGSQSTPVQAQSNIFYCHLSSEYAVSPADSFDLTNSQCLGVQISSDIFVTTDGDDTSDGLTWNTAFQSIQHALSTVVATDENPVTIYVGPGTFNARDTHELFTLPLVSHVRIVGSGMDNTILDCDMDDACFRAEHLEDIELTDLTISQTFQVAALFVSDTTSFNIRRVRFYFGFPYNSRIGAGVYFCGSSGTIEECVFDSNYGYFYGGGCVLDNSNMTIQDTVFRDNVALYFDGAAIYAINDSVFELDGCIFESNISNKGYGGAVFCSNSHADIRSCEFRDNYAPHGAALAFLDQSTMTIGGDAASGNLFSSNIAGAGADILCDYIPAEPFECSHNTFEGNAHGDYFVSPADAFNLNQNTSLTDLITTDVYVSPDGSDENDGLTENTPFKTLQHAMRLLKGTPESRVTVHMASGRYTPSLTGEIFPVPMIPYVTVAGTGEVELCLELPDYIEPYLGGGMAGWFDEGFILDGVQITDATTQGAIRMYQCHNLAIMNCQCIMNYSWAPMTYEMGGAVICYKSSPLLFNCLIDKSFANDCSGGGLCCRESSPQVINCSIVRSLADEIGGGIYCYDAQSDPVCRNLILHNNTPNDYVGENDLNITHSCSEELLPGEGNFQKDPKFILGPSGLFYLSQIASGQEVDSPCIDSGDTLASAVCPDISGNPICLDHFTTRTDTFPDTGYVDIGYHYSTEMSPPTPTPTSTPSCSETGAVISMPSRMFSPGTICSCDVTVCNATGNIMTEVPLWVILDVWGALYYAPSFTLNPDNYLELYSSFQNGETHIQVLPQFSWPSGCGSASGVRFYAALTDPEMTKIIGQWSMWEFGWE